MRREVRVYSLLPKGCVVSLAWSRLWVLVKSMPSAVVRAAQPRRSQGKATRWRRRVPARGAERPPSRSSMWAFGRRAATGLLPRTASRASAWVGNPCRREPIGTCGRRGLHVTANASAIRHAVSTRAAGPHTGAQAAPAPMPGTRSAHAPGRTGWTGDRGQGTRGVCAG